jgi:aminoglycoside phosphotransferase (APT) family kinase protein
MRDQDRIPVSKDRQGRGDPELDLDRLLVWLTANVPGVRGPLSIEQFAGGQSNPTYKLTASARQFVLRRKPHGQLLSTAHAIDREYRILSSLAGSNVPVPSVVVLCEDPAVIGSAFYIMDYVEGRLFWDPRLPDLRPSERAGIFDSMNATIAALHSIDPNSIGMSDFGRPGNFLARQIARWSKQYRASETEPIDSMERLIEWLPKHLPPEGERRIVHGDYRLDNIIIHPVEPRVIAVLDWELSTIGDPIADFAYHVMAWRIAPSLFRGLADIDFERLQIPTEGEYVARYCERTGRDRIEHWEYYIVYSMFRIAAILQGIVKRANDGTAADINAGRLRDVGKPIADLAWTIAGNLYA